jgi:energy-coupling factor transporter ATP-binding protein EcfA2
MAVTVTPSGLTEVRLTSFKSYRNQTLPLGDLTLVVGRNGSGKSNALDGLLVLARLATREDISEAPDGSRDASNLSAAIGSLIREDPVVRARLVEALNDLNERDIVGLGVETSRLGDVILTVTERAGRSTPVEVSARSVDGTLRFLAILTALWQAPESPAPPARSSDDAVGQTQMVIEELANGLEGSEHGSVVACQRDADGSSTLTRLVDIDGYVEIAAMSSPGPAAAADRLRGTPRPSVVEAMQFLDELLGAQP